MRKSTVIEAGSEMHAGARGLFALLNKASFDENGQMRRPVMMGVSSEVDGAKLTAAMDLLESGMKKWATLCVGKGKK